MRNSLRGAVGPRSLLCFEIHSEALNIADSSFSGCGFPGFGKENYKGLGESIFRVLNIDELVNCFD